MGLSACMWTSVSGLLSHGQKMNVVGNNLANVSTIGFKAQRMDFEDYLYVDKGTGLLTFKPYFRKTPRHAKDRLLRYLEHGWVKESSTRIKMYESVPKRLGAARNFQLSTFNFQFSI